jgi:predicted phosphodiesterase
VASKSLHCPVLVFGGPYGNLQATSAMKSIAEQNSIGPLNTFCTGDIVAYCGNPQETVSLIRDWGCHVVMGNCEESVGFNKDDCGCGFEQGSMCAALSSNWYDYAVNQINADDKQWMQTLPRTINFNIDTITFSIIHGGIEDISEFIFKSTQTRRKQEIINFHGSDCIIGGHCGIPFGHSTNNGFWLNPGVIGMPANDGQQHGWYMIIESTENGVICTWHKLKFDNQGAIFAMQKAGIPDEYQKTLEDGLWPSMSILPEQERHLQGVTLNPTPVLLDHII